MSNERDTIPELPRSIYIAFEVYPRPKGASSHITAMVQGLARKFAPVWLLCCGFAEMPSVQIQDNVVIHRYKVHHPNMLRRAEGFGNFVHEKLRGLPHPPEIGIFRDPWGGSPGLAALPDLPFVFEVNALPSWELPYNFPAVGGNPALLAKIEDLERYCLKHAAALITVSEVTRRALVEFGANPRRITVIPNSAAEIYFKAARENGADGPGAERLFGYVGSLHTWQGVDVLVEAWDRIRGDFPKARLMIVHNGRKAPLKRLRKRIAKRGLGAAVMLQAPLSAGELAGLLPEFEFTCAPLAETYRNTHQGCCPIKIVESMAAGVPVAASNLEVARSLIRHDVDGRLVRPDCSRTWALEIGDLLDDGSLRRRLADGASKTASDRFTREKMFGSLDRVIHQAIH